MLLQITVLLGGIAQIFNANLSNNLRRFGVPDSGINRSNLRVVLLLESPHTDEVCYGYPLAGNAGIHVRKVLEKCAGRLLPNEPIGRSVYEYSSCVPRLGIMNVSQLPFQECAYRNPNPNGAALRTSNRHGYFKCMKHIRKKPNVGNYRGFGPTRHLRNEINQLRNAIVEDLKWRLECLSRNNPDVLLICCGWVAQRFYTKTGIVITNTCCLPHPSRQGWENLDCQDARLQNILRRIWPPQAGT